MTTGTTWAVACGEQAERLHADAARALAAEAVELGAPSGGPGIVFFSEAGDGVRALVREAARTSRVMAVACEGSALSATAVTDLLAAGAADVIAWADGAAAHIAARVERWRRVDELVDSPRVRDVLVGRSTVWLAVLRRVVEIARFGEGPILVTGESGTGKELVARLVHALAAGRDDRPLILLDCTTVVPTLSGSEFFGHERGSFTGAIAMRAGAFELAHGGTLFLDEVGELPRALQAELLRVVQEGTFKRVGSNTWRETRFRLVCATNRDVWGEEGFRRDFYHRIAAWTVRLPSLAERRDDILPLARHFLAGLRAPGPAPALDPVVRRHLVARDYPGNVRDLRQLMLRVHHRHVGPGPVTMGDLDEDERSRPPARWCEGAFAEGVGDALAKGATLKQIGAAAVDLAVERAVADADGNLACAARRLGVTPRALQLRRASSRPSTNGRHADAG